MPASEQATTRRRRLRVDGSYVDLHYREGVKFHLQLHDVSGSGIGFPLPHDVEPLSPGTQLACVLALEGHRIPGKLEVARDERSRRSRLCGARFHADERFRRRFDNLMTELELSESSRPANI